MRRVVRRALGRLYTLTVAAKGEEALAQSLANPPDLILTEATMPRKDGLELIRKLHAAERTATVPIIILSTRAGEEPPLEGLEKAADDYLVSPVSALELRARVRTHLSLTEFRNRSEDTIRRLSRRLMMVHEDEQMRLARELPDDLGQRTAVVEFTVRRLQEALGVNAVDVEGLLELLSSQVGDLAHRLRAASHRLHPSALENLGLATALRMLVEEQQLQNGEVRFIKRGSRESLPSAHTTALYRIAQEAMRNAARHAAGAPMRVALIYGQADVELRIEDAGEGFDIKEIQGKGGIGLLSMQERARSIGATFVIDSTIGEGTNICVRVPLGIEEELAK